MFFVAGKAALILLVIALAVTPANFILGWKAIVKIRKSMGLWAFFYVSLHFLGADHYALRTPALSD